jgi:hypothetical protein
MEIIRSHTTATSLLRTYASTTLNFSLFWCVRTEVASRVKALGTQETGQTFANIHVHRTCNSNSNSNSNSNKVNCNKVTGDKGEPLQWECMRRHYGCAENICSQKCLCTLGGRDSSWGSDQTTGIEGLVCCSNCQCVTSTRINLSTHTFHMIYCKIRHLRRYILSKRKKNMVRE